MPFVAGELVTDDFRRNELSKTRGEPVLDEPDGSIDWLLVVRSMTGTMLGAKIASTDASIGLFSSSGKRENQSLELPVIGSTWSTWNIGEHSKLSLIKGD